jgi:hypothetical protein
MIQVLYASMAIPDACLLGKRVFKKLFHENAKLGTTDKKAFREDIDTITWQYTLKPSTIPILPYEYDQREYHEVAVLHVDLKTRKRTARIAEIMHRAIPYPLLIVFAHEKVCALSTAHKRFSQAEKGAVVAEDFMITDWIDLSNPTPVQKDFMASLVIAALPHTHFFAFYSALVDRLVALDCAGLTGAYRLESAAAKRRARRDRLAACHDLKGRIDEIRAAIKKETQFNRQVDLNTKMKELEKQLKKKAAGL